MGGIEQMAQREIIPHVDLIPASGLKPEPIRWIFPGYLARGKFHVIAGAPGTGKTTIAASFAGCVTSGAPFPSGWRPAIGNVLIWSGEDDPADTLVPRLIAAGADLARVHFVGDAREDGQRRPFDPARDIDLLAEAAASVDNVCLLIVDPVVSAVSGDSHKNAEVRRGLAPLVDLAVRLDAALLGVTHYSKGTGGRDPLERVTGSIAFGALARVVLGTVRMEAEDGQPQRMMMARAKSNIGPDGGGFVYAFEQIELAGFPGVSASRIVWGAAVEGTARELLAEPEADDRREAPAREEAEDWLREMLEAGPIRTEEVKAEAKAAGLTWSTIRRAKDAIGAKAVRQGYGEDGGWFWKLPDPVPVKDAHVTLHPENVSAFDEGERLWTTARVPEGVKDAQGAKDAKDAHLHGVSAFGEHLSTEGDPGTTICPRCNGEGCGWCEGVSHG